MATLTMLTSSTDMNMPVIKTASGTSQPAASGALTGAGAGGAGRTGATGVGRVTVVVTMSPALDLDGGVHARNQRQVLPVVDGDLHRNDLGDLLVVTRGVGLRKERE